MRTFLVGTVPLLTALGCRSVTGSAARDFSVSIPHLAYASADRLDATLGKPLYVSQTKDRNAPDELRMYALGSDKGMLVGMRSARAIQFNLGLPMLYRDAREGMAAIDLNVQGAKPVRSTPDSVEWRGRIGGLDYERAMVYRVSNNAYNMAFVRLKTRG